MIHVTINGDKIQLDNTLGLIDLLDQLKIESDKVAVEHNREIVPKSTFDKVSVNDGDQLEIVHFIGGG